MATILVVGASGYLGRFVTAELAKRGHRVRVVVRDRAKAEAPGKALSPGIGDAVDEWIVGDITDPSVVDQAVSGVEWVFSSLGVTTQGVDPWMIDYGANLAVLKAAVVHEVAGFTYIDVVGADGCPAPGIRAKTAFVGALEMAPLTAQVIRPSGFFSDMAGFFGMARRGFIPLLNRTSRGNPIHGADLAAFSADRIDDGQPGRWDVGGPDVMTWAEIADLAFEVAGKQGRVVQIPPKVMSALTWLVGMIAPRRRDGMTFINWVLTHDSVGEPTGTHHLAEFFAILNDADTSR